MSFWLTLALQVVSFIATALLAPKPQTENAKPARLGDFRFPQSDEGSPVPIFWGRVRMRGPNTMWYGNLEARPIRERVRVSPFKKKSIIVGYQYFLTLDMALGLLTGTGSRLRRIWFGERWLGKVTWALARQMVWISWSRNQACLVAAKTAGESRGP